MLPEVTSLASLQAANAAPVYLGNGRLLARTVFGGYLVVPTSNVDVAVGIVRDGIIEPWIDGAVAALLRPGETYVNAGANFGYYTVRAGHIVGHTGKVISIEANRHLIPDLGYSIYYSGLPNIVQLHNTAVSDVSGTVIPLMFDPQFIGGGSVIHSSDPMETQLADCYWTGDNVDRRIVEDNGRIELHRSMYTTVDVATSTLDDICGADLAVDLLHMDIEGSEVRAIMGAKQMINRSPNLKILMEWSPHYVLSPSMEPLTVAMHAFLAEQDYELYRVRYEDHAGPGQPPFLRRIDGIDGLRKEEIGDILAIRKHDNETLARFPLL